MPLAARVSAKRLARSLSQSAVHYTDSVSQQGNPTRLKSFHVRFHTVRFVQEVPQYLVRRKIRNVRKDLQQGLNFCGVFPPNGLTWCRV